MAVVIGLSPIGSWAAVSPPLSWSERLNILNPPKGAVLRDHFQKQPPRSLPASPSHHNLLRTSEQIRRGDPLPLAGLRVALDPGHIGSAPWDNWEVKWVQSDDGSLTLREGMLVLQACLLLKQKLEGQGAQVFVTRSAPRPVNPAYTHSSLRKIELEERARVIREFRPDLTLIIHMDMVAPTNLTPAQKKQRPAETWVNRKNGTGVNWVKSYVAGNMSNYFLKRYPEYMDKALGHALDPHAWSGSVLLSRQLNRSIHKNLGIPIAPDGGTGFVRLPRETQGVYARGLALSLDLMDHPVAYVESLYYNGAAEFDRLSRRPFTMLVDGVSVPYSQRLKDLASALDAGIIAFVRAYDPAQVTTPIEPSKKRKKGLFKRAPRD